MIPSKASRFAKALTAIRDRMEKENAYAGHQIGNFKGKQLADHVASKRAQAHLESAISELSGVVGRKKTKKAD